MTTNVRRCEDGKYRWSYDMNMYKNPAILITVLKVVSIAVGAIWLFSVLISVGGRDFWWDGFLKMLGIFALIEVGGCVLGTLAYLLVAAAYGGKYIVEFEMDEEGVRHTQTANQAKKAGCLGLLTVLVGLAAKNPTTVGTGMMSGTKTTMYTEFSKVKKVRPYPEMHVIKLNAPLNRNQVYVDGEEFGFVLDFINKQVSSNNR